MDCVVPSVFALEWILLILGNLFLSTFFFLFNNASTASCCVSVVWFHHLEFLILEMVHRSAGSAASMPNKISLASGVNLAVRSWAFQNKSYLLVFNLWNHQSASALASWNGGKPAMVMNRMTPREKISTALSYLLRLRISGAAYPGVPNAVTILKLSPCAFLNEVANPKSTSFTS